MSNGFFLPSNDPVFPDDGSTTCSLCGGTVGPWVAIGPEGEPRPACAYCVGYVDNIIDRAGKLRDDLAQASSPEERIRIQKEYSDYMGGQSRWNY